nr:immunoglobulin heavy chain junction region [Macaca mulatta]MOW33631.1 immunoglobulin heavy chain junction region [Macaca mulatta]
CARYLVVSAIATAGARFDVW